MLSMQEAGREAYPELAKVNIDTAKEAGRLALVESNHALDEPKNPFELILSLTPTEVIELEQASLGFNPAEAAKKRLISSRTVGKHRKNIIKKLGVHNMAHAVAIGIEAGILQLNSSKDWAPRLTPKEVEVLSFLAMGFKTDDIAKRLGRSVFTIRSHRQRMLEKFVASNTPQAVRLGYEQGILPLTV